MMTFAQKTEVPRSVRRKQVSIWGKSKVQSQEWGLWGCSKAPTPVAALCSFPRYQKGWGGVYDGRRYRTSGQRSQITQGLVDHGKKSGLCTMGNGKPLAGGEEEGEIIWLLEKNTS